MRIGMILDKPFPPDPRVENEATYLANNGFDVFLFCLSYDKSESRLDKLNGINICRYFSNKLTYKLSALAYTFPFYKYLMKGKIRHFIEQNNIQALHVHDITIAETVFSVNKSTKLPLILDLHDNLPEIMRHYPHVKNFPGNVLISPKKWKKKEAEFLSNATEIVTVSQEFKAEIVSRGKVNSEKIRVVPNTVRKEFYEQFELNEPIVNGYHNNFVILYVGDTGIRRGLLTAINAIPLLKAKIKNVKLVIVGSNSEDHILKERVKKLNISDHVDFQGWQDVSLFPSYIKASQIGISPLHRNIQHDVAYPNKLFQYMSFGIPVLVSDATAQKNLVSAANAGWIHKEQDAEDFAEKILVCHKNVELTKAKGENGHKFIRNDFYWEKTSSELVNLYQNLSR